METTSGEEKLCIHCKENSKDGDPLNHVDSKFPDRAERKHPVDTLIEHASKLSLNDLVTRLEEHKRQKIPVLIHLSCRTCLKNQSCSKRKAAVPVEVPVS